MQKQIRNKRGQYKDHWNGVLKLAIFILFLSVVWSSLNSANNEAQAKLDTLRGEYIDSLNRYGALREQAVKTMGDPDLSRFKNEVRLQAIKASNQEVIVTAYNTVENQTDSSPCISANGDNICGRKDCVVASNVLSFGTIIELETVGTCTVVDRMNKRYDGRYMDISFDKDIVGAVIFGVKRLDYYVVR